MSHGFYFYLRKVEAPGSLSCVETPQSGDVDSETFAQVLDALKAEYDVKEPAIADRIGVHVSTVNNWANGKANPRPGAVRDLARYFPKLKDRLLSAAKIRVPAPLPPDGREAVLKVFDRLTEEQRQLLLIQASAVADSNEQ